MTLNRKTERPIVNATLLLFPISTLPISLLYYITLHYIGFQRIESFLLFYSAHIGLLSRHVYHTMPWYAWSTEYGVLWSME